ncbi:hypothetical protein GIB67_031501 [Kingdonia uniflora]|uniref:Uncharacterized protein n=1 Tax=Kingdonia uniflora TaxID=39325 RepID=A0A7J7MNL6_9MAGN|nr:hypothetical protein GIB67_031501 [Kingdonia uniflora]
MDSNFKLTTPQVPSEPMDFLSREWCNSAIVLQDRPIIMSPLQMIDKKLDDGDLKSLPSWKSNDLKMPTKLLPFKSIKKWVKEIKQRRKDEDRLHKAEVHAAVSVAGVAAALAAVAAENNTNGISKATAAVASAAALVAEQCALVAESIGANRRHLSTVIGSAMTSGCATEILTLTAAAATSLRGASTLRSRPGGRERVFNDWNAPVLPIKDKYDFDFDKCRSLLAKGSDLSVKLSNGKSKYRSVSIIQNNEAKVVLKIRKIKKFVAFASTKQSVVLNLHTELYRDSLSTNNDNTSYYIVLTTAQEIIKLDMEDDYDYYNMWAATINHMLTLSPTFTGNELQLDKNCAKY